MNIMVFDVPAESGGALSVLKDFYQEALSCKDKTVKWIFVVSTLRLEETDNIKVLRFPWIKKSWLHRLYFDNFTAAKLVEKYRADKVLSLQNVVVPNVNVPQVLYVHNAIPFIDYKFSFRENKLLWVYQNIIGKSILNSVKSAQKVIVQTQWMKRACVEKTGVKGEKIEVVPPKINVEIKKFFEATPQTLSTFFYPASGVSFKNHKVILEACKKLKDKKITDYKIIFTLKGDENEAISEIYRDTKEQELPIDFVGSLLREEVFELYTKSVLLFPSYVETFGLPMLEAKRHQGMILASDCPFSHEILDGYKNAYFFDPFDASGLVELIGEVLSGRTSWLKVNFEEIEISPSIDSIVYSE